MMDQQRETQNQQQQQRNHHRRPPDVEEALSSMLWTPYERTPTDSSSDDDDERLNRKLRKSQSSYEYYQYGGLTLAPPAAIMPFFGSNDPITPFVPLSNHQDSLRNNNNINNNNILRYSGTSINNNNADYFRKTDRCDNFRFSYPYYGPIPSLNKCLSVEPPSYDSLYSKTKDATRVLSNLVTVSATTASGVLQTAYTTTGSVMDTNESYGQMVHSFTDNFVIECNSLTSSSSSPSTSSTTSVTQTLHQQKPPLLYNNDENNTTAPTLNVNNLSITINDVKTRNGNDDYQHKANREQKQTEVNQLPTGVHQQQHQQHYSPTKININREQKREHTQKPSPSSISTATPNSYSTTLQQRTHDKERNEERSGSGEPSEVSSLSTFVANGLGLDTISCRSLTIAATTTATVKKSCVRGLVKSDSPVDLKQNSRDAQLSHIDLPEDKRIIGRDHHSSSSDCAKELIALAMRLNIPATVTDVPIASSNVANCGKNVSVTTSSVFLSNSIANPNNRNSNTNSVAILSSSSAPSLTIQVNDSCSNTSNNNSAHGDFVVNQSIANNGISVVNCTYAYSDGGSSANNSKSSSSSVPKNIKLLAVNNNNQTNTKISPDSAAAANATALNGLQQNTSRSPTRTFTSTECQTDDIPHLIRDDESAQPVVLAGGSISGGGGGGSADGNGALVRTQLHPDALLSREQRRRERRERRQQQHVQQQQMQHQRLSRHHSHSHPPPQQTPILQHPAHHTMSAAAAAMLRPMLPDILHSHYPPPYSALPLSQGAPPPPPPLPQATSLITPVISTVPIAATATMVGDGRFSIPLPIIRRSPSERSGKGCCGQWFAGPPLRALIAVVALGGVACALGGAALGATGLAGQPSSHLTAALLMIGVGVVLVTVSGAAWRLTAPGGPPCLGLGSSVDLGRCGRRPCSRGGGAPHGLLYPEFQHRPPPPSYQASMQEYRLRLLLLDRDRQNGVVRGSSPPPTYRSHAGSLLRAPLTTTIRGGNSNIGGPGSEYSLPPSYRSRNATPAIISSERTIETAPSGRLLANEDIPESSMCTIPSNLSSSLPAYNVIISEDLHQQPQQNNSSSRNAQTHCALDNSHHSQQKDNASPNEQITQSTLGDAHHSSSTSKEFSSSADRNSSSLQKHSSDGIQIHPREQVLHLSEKFNPRVLANNSSSASNRTIGLLNVHSTISALAPDTMAAAKTKSKDLVTIVTISAQDNTNQLPSSASPPTGEMEILAHL